MTRRCDPGSRTLTIDDARSWPGGVTIVPFADTAAEAAVALAREDARRELLAYQTRTLDALTALCRAALRRRRTGDAAVIVAAMERSDFAARAQALAWLADPPTWAAADVTPS